MEIEHGQLFNDRGQLNGRLLDRMRDYAYDRTRVVATYDGTVDSGSSGTLIVPSAAEAGATLSTCSIVEELDDSLLVLPFTFASDNDPQLYNPDLGMLEVASASWSASVVTFGLVMPASSATVSTGGTGYVVNDLLTVAGGTVQAGGSAAKFKVATIGAGGAVLTVTLDTPGNYTATPGNPAVAGGGTGTGCTLNLTYAFVPTTQALSATVAGVGTGYVVGDVLTQAGGTFTTAAQWLVATVGGGGTVAAVTLQTAGSYSVTPASPAATTGGTGTGCTLNVTYQSNTKFQIIESNPFKYNGIYTIADLPSTTTIKAVLASNPGTYVCGADFIDLTTAFYVAKPYTLQRTPWDGEILLYKDGTYHFIQYQSVAITATIEAAGTGYVVGDVLTQTGGTLVPGGAAAQWKVATIGSGGAVTGVVLAVGGNYEAVPTNPVMTTGGTGTGCTLDVFYQAQRLDTTVKPEMSDCDFLTDGSGNFLFASKSGTITEVIQLPYITGDVLTIYGGPTGMVDPNSNAIVWTDDNVGARAWVALSSDFLALLTAKDYTIPGYPPHSWIEYVDSNSPSPLSFTAGPRSGGPNNFPAYILQGIDVPLPWVARLHSGSGPYYIAEVFPRTEIVNRTDINPDSHGYYPGVQERYDQGTKLMVGQATALIVDVNSLP